MSKCLGVKIKKKKILSLVKFEILLSHSSEGIE